VIHYGFENDANMKREGNEHDRKNLQDTFSNYTNCTYKEVASPQHTEISNILGENGMKLLFTHEKGLNLEQRV